MDSINYCNQQDSEGQKKQKNINPIITFIGSFVFRVALDFVYALVICKIFYHYGFVYDLHIGKLFLSYAAMIGVLAAFVPQVKLERPGSVLLLTVMLMAFVPNMSLFACMNLPYEFFFMSFVFWMLIALFYRIRIVKQIKIRIRLRNNNYLSSNGHNSKWYWIFLLVFIIVFVYSTWYNQGISLRMNLSDANDIRMAAREKNINEWVMRIFAWSGNVVFPLGLIFSVKRRKIGLFVIMVVGELAAYAVNGTKSWLFVAFLALFMAVFVKKDNRIGFLPWMFSGTIIAGIILSSTNKLGYFVNNYIARRVFFATSLNNYYWIDFFSNNPKLFFTNSSLGWIRRFTEVPYDVNVASIIGEVYYGMPTSNASSGTIACAYANLGWLGLPVYALLTVFLIELLDIVSNASLSKVPIIYLYPIIISAAEYLVNGHVLTVAITYGYLVGVIIIAYLRNQGVFYKR